MNREERNRNGATGTEAGSHDDSSIRRTAAPGAVQAAHRRGDSPAGVRSLPDTFLDERDDVLGVINELEDQLDRYEEIRAALERGLSEAQEQGRAGKQRIQELEWQSVALQTRVDALEQVRQDLSLLEEEIADANIRTQRMSEQLTRTEKDNQRLTGELKAATKQLEELWVVRKERDGLRIDLKTVRGKLEQLETAQRELIEERNLLHTRSQETLANFEEAKTARHQTELQLRTAEDKNEELRRVQESISAKLEAAASEKKAAQAQLTHVERENARLHEQQKFLECELSSLRGANRSNESALSNVKKAFAEVRIALAETKSRARRRTIEHWPRVPGSELSEPQTATSATAD